MQSRGRQASRAIELRVQDLVRRERGMRIESVCRGRCVAPYFNCINSYFTYIRINIYVPFRIREVEHLVIEAHSIYSLGIEVVPLEILR